MKAAIVGTIFVFVIIGAVVLATRTGDGGEGAGSDPGDESVDTVVPSSEQPSSVSAPSNSPTTTTTTTTEPSLDYVVAAEEDFARAPAGARIQVRAGV